MIYKNHKKIDLEKDSFYISKESEFTKFLKGKKNVVFQNGDKIRINKGTGLVEPPRIQTVAVKNTVPDESGFSDDTWVYCERSPRVLQNGEVEYDLAPIMMRRSISIPTTKKDKIFYMMYLSPAAISGRTKVLDLEQEAVNKVEQIKAKTRVDFLLTDDEFNILDDSRKRVIAKSFGVANVDALKIESVVLKLKSIIDEADKQGDKDRGTDAFLEAVKNNNTTDIKANVQDALDKGKVKYEEKNMFFYYADGNGNVAKKIVSVEPINSESIISRLKTIHNYYIDNPDKLKELRRVLGLETSEVDFSKVEYAFLKKWVAHHGLDGKGTKEELIKKAEEFYEKNKGVKQMDMTLLEIAGDSEE